MFDKFIEELLIWNKKINLISRRTSREEITKNHIEDSLIVSKFFDFSSPIRVIDIGAGAGFPSIPLKIKFPNIDLVLVDSTRKKIDFLKHIISALNLKNTTAVWDRAENLVQKEDFAGKFNVAFARAVSKLNTSCKYALPFLKRGGTFIAQKSENPEDEIEEAKKTLCFLGGQIYAVHKFKLSKTDLNRSIILIEKIIDKT